MDSQSRHNSLFLLLKIGFVGAILWFLVSRGDLDLTRIRFVEGRMWLLFVSLGCLAVTMTLSFLRWHLLLRGNGIILPFPTCFRLGCIGAFFNTFLLGALGGDVIKIAYVVRETHQRAAAAISVLVDRFCGLLGLLSLGAFSIFINWREILDNPDLHVLAVILFTLLACVAFSVIAFAVAGFFGRVHALAIFGIFILIQAFLLHQMAARTQLNITSVYAHAGVLFALVLSTACAIFTKPLLPGGRLHSFVRTRVPGGNRLIALIDSIFSYRHRPGTLCVAFLLSLMLQGNVILGFAALSYALGNPASIFQIFFAAPPSLIANVLPVPMGGLGVGEACYANILKLCVTPEGNPVENGAAAFLAFRAMTILANLLFGLPAYLRGKREIETIREETLDSNPEGSQ